MTFYDLSMHSMKIISCAEPSISTDVATKNYVDARTLADVLTTNNSAGSSAINMNNNKINLCGEPSISTDVATKFYVDGKLATSEVPIGAIIMWSNYNSNPIPSNYALCDGTAGTPDLRGRFILSSGTAPLLTSRIIGQTGGIETVTLDISQIPSHNHNVNGSTSQDGDHFHTSYVVNSSQYQAGFLVDAYSGYNVFQNVNTTNAGTHSHTINFNSADTGGGQSHENMPPFYVLAYIMRIS